MKNGVEQLVNYKLRKDSELKLSALKLSELRLFAFKLSPLKLGALKLSALELSTLKLSAIKRGTHDTHCVAFAIKKYCKKYRYSM